MVTIIMQQQTDLTIDGVSASGLVCNSFKYQKKKTAHFQLYEPYRNET